MLLKKPKLLVLDGQGVVFDAPIKSFLLLFTRHNNLAYESVIGRWQDRLRHLAWTGAIEDEALWNELAGRKVDVKQTMRSLSASYRPGPVAKYLISWSRRVPIWLLSNHRSHWVLPQLDSLNLAGTFQQMLISDLTGIVKPDPNAFTQLLNGDVAAEDILFVDDQIHNARAADKLGLRTIHASPELPWVNEIDRSLRA